MRVVEENKHYVRLQCEFEEDWKIMAIGINVDFLSSCIKTTLKKSLYDMKNGIFNMPKSKARYYNFIN